MFKKKLLSGLGLAATLAFSGASSAATITNTDGNLSFGGFDWAQDGVAFTTGFVPVAGTNFTMTYFADAIAIVDAVGTNIPNFQVTHMDTSSNGIYVGAPPSGYEYTIVAVLNEQVISCDLIVGSCNFIVTGGTFTIKYDLASNANSSTGSLGTGFTDGTTIIAGTVNAGAISTFSLVSGSNSTTLQGIVTTTNNAFVNPNLVGTTATTTLQIGAAQTNNFSNPGGFNGVPFTPANTVFQADANQSFTQVPEPGSLALIAAGLFGLFGLGRRRNNLA